jgi:hypothetical protein
MNFAQRAGAGWPPKKNPPAQSVEPKAAASQRTQGRRLPWAANSLERSRERSFGLETALTRQALEVPIQRPKPTRLRYLSKPDPQFHPVKSSS